MSDFSDFFPAAGGGGLTPKFQEFNTSGTFTPTQALIDAGGYIEVFLVAGGGKSFTATFGASGGEAFLKRMYLTSTTGCTVTIGAGATSTLGSNSSFAGSSAGGVDLDATAGDGDDGGGNGVDKLSPSWPGFNSSGSGGNGFFGYGAGGSSGGVLGVKTPKPNSGQGGGGGGTGAATDGGSGYCLIKWFE
tara:strand:+ start:13 stop:582 length:570 start_codon:yes stop_codon:yes gene_type:complete